MRKVGFSVNYRNYKSEDYSELIDMIFALYQEDPEGEIISQEKVDKTINELSSYPEKGKILVFEENTQIVGYAILIFYWSNEYGGDILNIDELFVSPSSRNQRIATRFFEHIFDVYRNKVSAFSLEVTPMNRQVLDYYKRWGFKEMSNTHIIYHMR